RCRDAECSGGSGQLVALAHWSAVFSGNSDDLAPIASFLFEGTVHYRRTANILDSHNSLRLRNLCRRGAVFVASRRDKRSTTPGGLVFGIRSSHSYCRTGFEAQGQNLTYARLFDWFECRISRQCGCVPARLWSGTWRSDL